MLESSDRPASQGLPKRFPDLLALIECPMPPIYREKSANYHDTAFLDSLQSSVHHRDAAHLYREPVFHRAAALGLVRSAKLDSVTCISSSGSSRAPCLCSSPRFRCKVSFRNWDPPQGEQLAQQSGYQWMACKRRQGPLGLAQRNCSGDGWMQRYWRNCCKGFGGSRGARRYP